MAGLMYVQAVRRPLSSVTHLGPGHNQIVSGFQTNTTFIRVTRTVSWTFGHADGVSFMSLPIGSPA